MKKNVILLCLFFLSVSIFSQEDKKNTLLFQIKWTDNILDLKTLPGLSISFTAYELIDDTTVAFLISDEQKIIIYSIPKGYVTKVLTLPSQSLAFDFDDGRFYILGYNNFFTITEKGDLISEYNFLYPQNTPFSVEFIRHFDERNLIMVASGSTYEIDEKGLHLLDNDYWYYPDHHKGRVEKLDYKSFKLFQIKQNSNPIIYDLTINELGLSGDLATVTILDVNDMGTVLDIETTTDDDTAPPKRFLTVIDNKGHFISSCEIPFIYFSYLKTPFVIFKEKIIYALISPEGVFFYPISEGKGLQKLPIDYDRKYHYNLNSKERKIKENEFIDFQPDNPNSGSNCVTRSQVFENAYEFRDVLWSATSSNIKSTCATISGDYYKTPTWVTVGAKQSVPYKWGGWTDWDDFPGFASLGKYCGSYATTSTSSPCPQPPYASSSDTYIIGDDCSGFVSRCWETSTKYSTSGLPGICQSLGSATTTSAFNQLQPGDVINDAGSHVRLCLSQNPSGSATFMEASAVDWRVSDRSYNMTALAGYTCLKYNNINDARLRLAQAITINPTTVVQGGPLTVTYKIGNYGSETWTGNVRLYIRQADGNFMSLQTQGPITLSSSQTSSTYTFYTASVASPIGTTELEVRVQNSSTSCNYGRFYKVGASSYSNPISFVITGGSPILSAPILISPIGNVTVTSVQLVWQSVNGASGYELDVDGNQVLINSGTTTSYNPSLNFGIHQWRARTKNSSGNYGNWSTYESFNYIQNPCSGVSLIPGCGSSYLLSFSGGGSGVWNTTSNSACGYTCPGTEKIYSFIAPYTGTYSIQVISSSGYVDYMWKPESCSATGWNCIDDIVSPGEYGSMSWIAGVTYYLLLDDEDNSAGMHTFYIKCCTLPTQPGTISGLSSICQNTTSTYSISPVTGATSYTWTLPSGWSGSSASTSISTVSGSNGGTIYVKANNSCGSSPQQSKSVTVNSVPSQPVSISGSSTVCENTSITYSISSVSGATSYTWTLPPGWSGNSTTTFINATAGTSGGTIYVKANNSCGSSPQQSKSVTVNTAPSQPGSISGSSTVCESTSNTYSISTVSGATSYTWTLPSGWSGSSTSNSINATAGTVGGTLYVTANNSCGSSPQQSKSVNVNNVPTQPGSISGPSSVCENTTNTYSISSVNGATSYTWSLPSGWSGGSTTTSINATAWINGGTIYVTANNSCGSSSQRSKSVSVTNIPAQPGTITGNSPVCQYTTNSYNISAVNGASSYTWVLPSGWSGSSVSTSIAPIAGTSGGNIYVTANNTCGSGPQRSKSVTVSVIPSQPGIISGSTPICENTTNSYSISPVAGATTYTWTLPSGWSGSSTSSSINATAGTGGGTIYVTANNLCGASLQQSKNVTVNNAPSQPGTISGPTPICQNTTNTYSIDPISGATSYTWTLPNGWNGTSTTTIINATAGNSGGTIYVSANNSCGSGPGQSKNVSVTASAQALVTISPSSNPSCFGNSVLFTATPISGGSSPSYQWKKNTVNISGATNSTYSYIPLNNDVITCQMTSNLTCATGSPALSNAVTMTVSQPAAVSVSINASANNVCQGNSVTFTAIPVNGGSSPAYQWKKNSTPIPGATNSTYTYAPANGDAITCELTSNATCISNTMATSNTVTMNVNPSAPVSISISPSSNPVCSGTSVTFTAIPVNGGASPGYQWKKNNLNISGATNQTYSYVPINGEVITCVLNSTANCATGSPATSNAITMVVNSALTAGITITASSNPACAGTVVTFTATPSNGGSSPGYQWKKGGVNIAGATNSTYSCISLNNEVFTCQMTSNLTCATGSPALSNAITMTVNQPVAVSVSIGASANNVCQGTVVSFTATPANGGSLPSYQWKKNGVNITGATNSTYSYAPANNDAITCELTSNASCIANTTATSNAIIMAVIQSAPVSISISPSSNPVCIGVQVNFSATTTNGGSSPGYQWKKNNVNISGATNSTYSYIPVNNDIITCTLTSNENCATGSPATSNAITMVVNSSLPAGLTIAASSNPSCAGATILFTASPVNGGSTPVYQWKKNGVAISGATNATYSYTPVNNDVITCSMNSSLSCASGNPATSNSITMTVNQPVAVSVSINASANQVCQGTSVTFTATPANGGSSPAYQWKKNGVNISGATNSTYSYAPVNNDVITCDLTSNAWCVANITATSNAIPMTVIPSAPVSITILSSANPVCSGTSVTFTSATINGGLLPGFQWKKNGIAISGATNSTYTCTPANNDMITCTLTSNETCATGSPATSNAINMSVTTSIPAGVSILASTNNVCAGTTVHFTAYPVNGGTSPGYQWKKNGVPVGTNQPTYSCIPQNFDVITCTLTSNLSCASGNPVTSNSVIMNITTPTVVGVLIYASANPSCSGVPVTYAATPLNGGSSPVFLWRKNGAVVGTNSSTYTYIPTANDMITCELTSNAICIQNPTAISNVINTAIIPSVPVSLSITSSANPVCSGTAVTFTATSVNGGNTPVYQWKKNGIDVGVNNPVLSCIPENGDVITCVMTSGVTCPTGSPATSNSITMLVDTSLPAGVSVTPSENPACIGSLVTFTAIPVNSGPAPVFQWKVNGINMGTNSTSYAYVPNNNDIVRCEMISNLGCATGNPAISNSVTMTMNPILPVSLNINASANPVCTGSSVTFTANPVNGGTSPGYQWMKNGVNVGTDNPVYSCIPQDHDMITCIMSSSEPCTAGNPATSNSITMTVNPNLPVGVAATASENPVCNGTSVTYTATPVNGGSAPAYQWRVNNILVGTNSPVYTYVPSNGDYIVCDLVSTASCATGNPATSNLIQMSVNSQLALGVSISVATNPVCIGSPASFTAYPVNGGLSPQFQWRVNGINAGTSAAIFSYIPNNGDIVSCEMTSSIACALSNPVYSNSITLLTVQPVPVSVSITTPLTTVCQGATITYTAFHINGGPAPVFHWKVNGINTGTNSQFFSYIPSNGDIVSCVLTSSLSCVTNTSATSNSITMTVDPLQPVNISITPSANPVLPGTTVTFTATSANGGSLPFYQWKVNGQNAGTNSTVFSYVPNDQDVVICEMTSNIICVTSNPVISNPVTMTVTSLPVGVTITSTANNICAGSLIEFTATLVNGGSDPQYQWQVNGINVGTNSPLYAYTPQNNDVVTCIVTSNAPYVTGNPATSDPLTMIVIPNITVSITISSDANPVCVLSPVTFTAVPVNGGTSPSYQWKVNGINAGVNGPSFTYVPSNNDIVTCRLTSSEICTEENPVISNFIKMSVLPVIPVSVSITASANPVISGSTVIFTATPVNPGISPSYQWNVNGVNMLHNNPVFTYVPSNGDQIVCLMTSGHSCASVNPAVSNTIIMTVNIVPAITVLTPDGGEYWIQGSVQNITWTDNISENVKIELLKGETYYETLVSSTPSTGSWSWTIPADQQVGIDYRIRITSVSDNAVTDNSDASFKIMANVVSNLVVQNMEIANGSINCFDALNTITVAGNGSFFHVTGGSLVTFIAGMNILFLPGTYIHDNGMMHGYIAPTGPFCGTMAPSFIQVTTGEEEPVLPSGNPKILIYPNPTTGKITLEFVPENLRSGARIYIYSINGAAILQKELPTMQKETFTLDFLPPGIYLCRILYDGKQELIKIVML